MLAVAAFVGLAAAAPAAAVAPGANGKLIYTLQTPGNYDIWTIAADGSGNAPLVADAANDQGGSWSPDGTKIVFRSDRTGAGDIYVADADGGNQVRLTTDPVQESHPSFSPDGTRIAFTRRDPDDEIFVMNADGSGAQRLTDNAVIDAGPDWSPDGTRIAYFSAGNVIHVMNADGSNKHPLDPGTLSVGPQWSPDARMVLFNRCADGGGECDPHAINADGTGLVNLGLAVPGSQAPTWSPDGTRIAFLTSTSGSDIWIMNADGSGAAPILEDALIRSGPRWQPIPRAPAAQTGAPSDVTHISAKLHGTIDSTILHPTTYWFEYGTTTAYGARTPDATAPLPVGPQAVAADIGDLRTGVIYHVRVVARNAIGTTAGADQTLLTSKATPGSLTVRVRPRRDRKLPFRYVVSGRLGLPAGVSAADACRGRVSVRVRRGKRRVATRRARLTPSCSYRKVVSIRSTRRLRRPRGRLRLTVAFPGNAVLTTRTARPRVVRFG